MKKIFILLFAPTILLNDLVPTFASVDNILSLSEFN